MPTPAVDADEIGATLSRLRETAPLVQCLTNIVAAQWSANVLLAAGASPAMVDNPHEAGEFAAVVGAVLVNTGTPYDDTVTAMEKAAASAAASETPWVLDPVAAGGLGWRTEVAQRLLETHRPTILRGNASEVLALSGGAGGKGVDATQSPAEAAPVAADLARRLGIVVAVSGEVDHLTDGTRLVRVANGHPWLTKVTGVGCALGAVMAACAAVADDALVGAATATALVTVAADAAAQRSRGVGSFAVDLLDEIHLATADSVAEGVRLS